MSSIYEPKHRIIAGIIGVGAIIVALFMFDIVSDGRISRQHIREENE